MRTGELYAAVWCTTGVRLVVTTLAVLTALAVAPVAVGKEGMSVVVIGPTGPPLVEPPNVFRAVVALGLRLEAPPREPFALVYPLMRNEIPARPGRWYPRSATYCSGWRSGIEAGCTSAPALRGWLGAGIATGLYRGEPVRLLALAREGKPLLPYGNEATAIKLALQLGYGTREAAPGGCIRFTALWSRPGWPKTFCVRRGAGVAQGGLYAIGRVYRLAPAVARLLLPAWF